MPTRKNGGFGIFVFISFPYTIVDMQVGMLLLTLWLDQVGAVVIISMYYYYYYYFRLPNWWKI